MSDIAFKNYLLATTIICGASLSLAAPAYAQEAAAAPAIETETEAEAVAAEGDEIVVTGSLFRRTNTETPSPVTVISSDSLEERGLNTAAEALQRVSAGNAGTMTQGWNAGGNFASGANAVSLRGLTVQSTLTIFDGLRMAPYPLADDGQRNFVDLNTIPSAIIDRIEVVRDGASSTYGADAVAGVINVITKKEIQGLHLNGSAGISQRGDAGEQRIDATYGYGDLDDQGFNFYVNGEYQKNDALMARDRGYPFNTYDWSRICNDAGACMANLNLNGVGADGAFGPLASIPGVALVRPVTTANGNIGAGRFSFLNAAAGCRQWDPVQLTAQQIADTPSAPANGLVCEVDQRAEWGMLTPDVQRFGVSTRFTANLGADHQIYAQGNYYQTDTNTIGTPRGFTDRPTAPRSGAVIYNVIAPVYVCATGVGTLNGVGTGCNAGNGVLNPYNPYAAAGQTAEIFFRSTRPTTNDTSARSLRGVIGLSGSFLDDWNYSADFTASNVQLDRRQTGYVIPQRLMDVVARGTFNFANPDATPESVWDYISPDSVVRSNSNLWQATGSVSRSLFELPGGPLQVAAGLAYRHESIDAPSANPQNDAHPYDRYYGLNAVGTSGSRNVFSAFGEIGAPILDQLEVNLSGRYDEYSTGQSNFSPKVGAKFTPIPQLAVRGTWSKGFRIPSFNEAFGLPTTGFVTRNISCATYAAAFCAAHNNNTYATAPVAIGLTNVGNPDLDPERSTSMTLGAIFEPIPNVSFTVDFWRIKVRDLIVGVVDPTAAIEAYYSNNGVVNLPGFIVTPGAPDRDNPNALPHIGLIQASYANANNQLVQGIDFGVNARFNLTDNVRLNSSFEASYLDKNQLTPIDPATGEVGDVQEYEGTLGPCNTTSCSGSPQWRASWQNTLDFGATTVSATAYYTSGYHMAAADYGGTPGDCESAVETGSAQVYSDGTPVLCRAKATWNVDLTASHKLNDKFTIYANVLNVLDIDAPFEPNAAYGAFGYNPAWAGANIIGRYFRLGAKVDF
jgi:iron complex outermembrane receptor protein